MASYLVPICFLFVVLTIVSSAPTDDKPLACPENEVYYKCQLEACFTKCDHLVNIPPCPSIVAGCYDPACLCKGGYLRTSSGTCVPEDQCAVV
ncbi:hypothetical protein B5X24_HaOG211927 [Helicoverpa armigera]|uniref:TIL domain-containing protein n=1 Tax=Helicoverpa armigera TaxID=29058 RepID=A0A2W1BAH0_HELAM|nr:hypothetical protein B5X24_HaOG211927 [Helicoverpa armigera]